MLDHWIRPRLICHLRMKRARIISPFRSCKDLWIFVCNTKISTPVDENFQCATYLRKSLNFWGPDLKCPCHSSFWPNDESTLSAEILSKSENLLSCYPFLPFFICKGRIPNSETCALWFDTFSFPLVTPKFNEKKSKWDFLRASFKTFSFPTGLA